MATQRPGFADFFAYPFSLGGSLSGPQGPPSTTTRVVLFSLR